jgi:hypothetical protein
MVIELSSPPFSMIVTLSPQQLNAWNIQVPLSFVDVVRAAAHPVSCSCAALGRRMWSYFVSAERRKSAKVISNQLIITGKKKKKERNGTKGWKSSLI